MEKSVDHTEIQKSKGFAESKKKPKRNTMESYKTVAKLLSGTTLKTLIRETGITTNRISHKVSSF